MSAQNFRRGDLVRLAALEPHLVCLVLDVLAARAVRQVCWVLYPLGQVADVRMHADDVLLARRAEIFPAGSAPSGSLSTLADIRLEVEEISDFLDAQERQ